MADKQQQQQQEQNYLNRPPDPAPPPSYPAPFLRLESRPGEGADGGVRIVAGGDLDLATAPALSEAMEAAAKSAAPGPGADPGRRAAVTVDLREVEFIDSAGLAALMEARRRWQGRCELTLVVAPGSQPARVVRLSRLDTYLTVESADPAPAAAASDAR